MDATRTTPIRAVITAGALAIAAVAAACSSTTAALPAPTTVAPSSTTTSSITSSTTTSTTTTVAPTIDTAPINDCWIELARNVGWPESTLAHLAYIINRESRCDPTQLADRPWTLDLSRGLLQINAYGSLDAEIRGRCGIDPAALFDPAVNLTCGLDLYRTYGWAPWGG